MAHGGESRRFENLVQQMEERYQGDEGNDDDEMPSDYDDEEQIAHFHVPQYDPSRDPKLWLVRLRSVGKERLAIMSITNLAAETIAKGKPWPIISVFAPENLRGYIYVEAHAQAHVMSALGSLQAVNATPQGVKAVPISEITQTIRVHSSQGTGINIKENDFVRVKRGLYGGDLGQVVQTDPQAMSAYIRLVPRVDFDEMIAKSKGLKLDSKRGTRPPRKLVSETEFGNDLPSVRFNDERLRTTVVKVGEHKFLDGFILRRVAISQLVVGRDANPTLAELRDFRDPTESNEDFLLKAKKTVAAASSVSASVSQLSDGTFVAGDIVQVAVGELMGVIGTITTIDTQAGRVVVKPDPTYFRELAAKVSELQLTASEIKKVFKVGDAVSIISGPWKKHRGTVTAVDENDIISVLSATTNFEIKTKSHHARIAPNAGSANAEGLDRLENFKLGDLVTIPSRSNVGVICFIDVTKNITLLLPDGSNIVVDVSLLGAKRALAHATAVDQFQNEVKRDSLIILNLLDNSSTPSSAHNASAATQQQRGKVIHVFGSTLFIKLRGVDLNNGFVAKPAALCRLISGSDNTPNNPNSSANLASAANQKSAAAANDGRPIVSKSSQDISATYNSRPDRLKGLDVRITGGVHKGKFGKVVESWQSIDKARVQLRSTNKAVEVLKVDLIAESVSAPMNLTGSAHGGATSSVGQSSLLNYFKSGSALGGSSILGGTHGMMGSHLGSHTGSHFAAFASANNATANAAASMLGFGGGFGGFNSAHQTNVLAMNTSNNNLTQSPSSLWCARGCVVRVNTAGAYQGKRGIVDGFSKAPDGSVVIEVLIPSDDGGNEDDVIAVKPSSLDPVRPLAAVGGLCVYVGPDKNGLKQHDMCQIVKVYGESFVDVKVLESQSTRNVQFVELCAFEDPGEEESDEEEAN